MPGTRLSTNGAYIMEQPEDTTNPNSNLLSDRLRESRIKAKRTRRRTDFGPSSTLHDDVFLAEAETPASTNRFREDASTASTTNAVGHCKSDTGLDVNGQRKMPGLREMDEKLQRLEKTNFDLKMEITFRRQREEKLQKQLDAMAVQISRAKKLQAEHSELIQLNDNLVRELEKRDEAVKEAVEIIVDLESKNELLQDQVQDHIHEHRPSTHSDSGYGGGLDTPKVIPPSSPPTHTPHTPLVARPAAAPYAARSKRPGHRIPSFVSDSNASTQALRDAYLDPARNLRPVKSFMSILSERESNQGEVLHELGSPRLSVLSESSFPSIYGRTRQEVESTEPIHSHQYIITKEDEQHWDLDHQQDSIKRVNRWMDDRTELTPLPRPGLASSGNRLPRSTTAPHLSRHEKVEASSTSDLVRDLGIELEYAGYPDGGSIDLGTPSRFQTRHTSPPADNIMFDGHGIDELPRTTPRRRQSSAEVRPLNVATVRPSYQRAETSPQTARFQSHADHVANNDHTATSSLRSPGGSVRKSVRATFAEKTQRLFGATRRTSHGQADFSASLGPLQELEPQPKQHRKRHSLAATSLLQGRESVPSPLSRQNMPAANTQRMDLKRADSHHDKAMHSVGMHHASSTETARRRSIDPASALGVQSAHKQGPAALSKSGAQAAWEGGSGGGSSRSGSYREKETGRKLERRAWRA